MASHNTNLYKSNTIVMWKGSTGHVRPAFVEARDNSNEAPDTWRYSITLLDWGFFDYVPEEQLRPMTFREFCWFRHPKTGKMKVGRNHAWEAIFIHVFALAVLIASPWSQPWWVPVLITLGMVAGFWIFTYKQFNGTQV